MVFSFTFRNVLFGYFNFNHVLFMRVVLRAKFGPQFFRRLETWVHVVLHSAQVKLPACFVATSLFNKKIILSKGKHFSVGIRMLKVLKVLLISVPSCYNHLSFHAFFISKNNFIRVTIRAHTQCCAGVAGGI